MALGCMPSPPNPVFTGKGAAALSSRANVMGDTSLPDIVGYTPLPMSSSSSPQCVPHSFA